MHGQSACRLPEANGQPSRCFSHIAAADTCSGSVQACHSAKPAGQYNKARAAFVQDETWTRACERHSRSDQLACFLIAAFTLLSVACHPKTPPDAESLQWCQVLGTKTTIEDIVKHMGSSGMLTLCT